MSVNARAWALPRGRAQESTGDSEAWGARGGEARAHKAQVLEVDPNNGTVLTVAPGVGLRNFQFDQARDRSRPNSLGAASPVDVLLAVRSLIWNIDVRRLFS